MRQGDEPIANISPKETIKDLQKQKLGFISQLDQQQLAKIGEADAVESAISNYELAYKMQSSVPELTEFKQETKATKKLYGFESDNPHTRGYAAQCLLARRLVVKEGSFYRIDLS